MQQENALQNANLSLDNRKRLTLTGVSSVDGFSETFIKLSVGGDKLTVTGEGLKITAFNKASGNFSCDGLITELKYNVKKQPMLKRIFK